MRRRCARFSLLGAADDAECTRYGLVQRGAISSWERSSWRPQSASDVHQVPSERNPKLCGRSSNWIGPACLPACLPTWHGAQVKVCSEPLLLTVRVYVCVCRHLVNTCTSQAGPLGVKGNQLLPPPPRLHPPSRRPPRAPWTFTVTRVQATRRGPASNFTCADFALRYPFVGARWNARHCLHSRQNHLESG